MTLLSPDITITLTDQSSLSAESSLLSESQTNYQTYSLLEDMHHDISSSLDFNLSVSDTLQTPSVWPSSSSEWHSLTQSEYSSNPVEWSFPSSVSPRSVNSDMNQWHTENANNALKEAEWYQEKANHEHKETEWYIENSDKVVDGLRSADTHKTWAEDYQAKADAARHDSERELNKIQS